MITPLELEPLRGYFNGDIAFISPLILIDGISFENDAENENNSKKNYVLFVPTLAQATEQKIRLPDCIALFSVIKVLQEAQRIMVEATFLRGFWRGVCRASAEA